MIDKLKKIRKALKDAVTTIEGETYVVPVCQKEAIALLDEITATLKTLDTSNYQRYKKGFIKSDMRNTKHLK